jgi:hypothetical protein
MPVDWLAFSLSARDGNKSSRLRPHSTTSPPVTALAPIYKPIARGNTCVGGADAADAGNAVNADDGI